ncbi:MAG TPA: hypothetical protein GXZ76_06600 [Clostridiaceae bacterium]|jgi:hypothetical protein|nr:hypothetical protein [Clostridiaceae bacterium]
MNNQNEKKEYNIAAMPATEVKQYTFGSDNEPKKRDQTKQNPRNRNRRLQSKRNQQNKKQIGKRTPGSQTATTDIGQKSGERAGGQQIEKTADQTRSGKQQIFQKQRKKGKGKRKLQSSVQVKLIETAADVKKDNQRIEKEIMLDIKEISRIEI